MIALVYWSLLSLFPVPERVTDYSYQTYYDILKNDKVIGYMMCSKVEKSETVEYTTESSARFSVLVDISVYSRLQSSFGNGRLLDGRLIRQVNGKTKADRQIAWVQDQYLIRSDGRSLSFKSKISFSTVCLMYAEPSGMTRIFSENFGQYVAIKEISPHRYVLSLPDGKDNIYTYHNGRYIEVEVHTSLATIYIKPRK